MCTDERSQVDIRFINVSRFLCLSGIYNVKRFLDLFRMKWQTLKGKCVNVRVSSFSLTRPTIND